MSRFPLLNTYQAALKVLAVLVIVGGVIAAFAAGSASWSFSFVAFIVTALPFLVVAIGFGITAELINLALSVEDHLAQMRILQERASRAAQPPGPTPPSPGYRSSSQSRADISRLGTFAPPSDGQ